MKLTKHTIDQLKNFSAINSGIVFLAGDFIMTRSLSGTTFAETQLVEGDHLDFKVAISNLPEFLNILQISGEPTITQTSDGNLVIKGDRSEIIWNAAEDDVVVSPKARINFPEPSLTFELQKEDYERVMKTARVLGADTLIISGDCDNVTISTYNSKIDTELEKPSSKFTPGPNDTGRDFNFILKLKNLLLQNDDYVVSIWGKGEAMATRWQGKLATYVIGVSTDSTHDF